MSAARPIGFGVIGCGNIGLSRHLRSLRSLPGVEVVALADPDAGALERAGSMVPARTYEDPDELLLDPRVVAVVIASPNAFHAAQARAACRAGKHVYVEKPIGTGAAEALNLVDAVQASNVRLATGFNYRFHPTCLHAQRLLQAGLIGEVRAVLGSFTEPLPLSGRPAWKRQTRTGGGALLDLGSHHFDLVRWMLGDEYDQAVAFCEDRDSELDGAHVVLTTSRGVTLAGHYRFTGSRANDLEFHGQDGILRADLHGARVSLARPSRRGYGVARRTVWPSPRHWPFVAARFLRPSYDPSFRTALAAFAASIRQGDGQTWDLADVSDGLAALQAALAADRASHEGVVVPVGA